MKNRLLCFTVLIMTILSSCDPRFDSDTRILTVGTVQDENGQPLENIEIGVYTSGRRFSVSSELPPSFNNRYLLGKNFTDNNGDFTVVSLFNSGIEFSIQIDRNDAYTNYVYATDSIIFNDDNLTIDLGAISLKKIADFQLNINRTSPAGTTLNFSAAVQDPQCLEFYQDGLIIPEESRCFETYVDDISLSDNRPDFSRSYRTFIGSIVTITYSINDGPETVETFTIDEENYTYDFSY